MNLTRNDPYTTLSIDENKISQGSIVNRPYPIRVRVKVSHSISGASRIRGHVKAHVVLGNIEHSKFQKPTYMTVGTTSPVKLTNLKGKGPCQPSLTSYYAHDS